MTSDSDIEMEAKIERPSKKAKTATKTPTEIDEKDGESDEEDSEVDPEEDDVPMSDLEGDDEDLEDIIPHTKLTINNKAALLASLNRIRIDTSSTASFTSHMTVVSSKPTAEAVPDAQDDLQRELALLSQSLEAARKGRALLIKEGTPFSRPKDYFAEMVKDDGQMEKVKAKLIEEASSKKAAAEARKLRDLKKFGKQVQVAKLQERQKAKKDTLEKIKTLKRSKLTPPP
ncbi:rRNA-processing protein EBP2 [Colletotrichum fioriniae]|uniref:rRNA-processing protein EBP2 n=1 Tax=Colletotrichum fioriniae TaxID=710243 RepID=UPI0032DA96CE|nr:rRNA-processing protein EBP2 [Colletotrichum fioriniae]